VQRDGQQDDRDAAAPANRSHASKETCRSGSSNAARA
jgi:hypothetical protein